MSDRSLATAPNFFETRGDSKALAVAGKLNGLSPKPLPTRDEEMVRLIGQYLCDKGYSNAYEQLAKDSGIVLEPQPATDLRAAILTGNWEATEKAVQELAPNIPNPASLAHIRFLLLEQQFLELLETEDVIAALTLLRNRITPLQPDSKRLQNLAQCLMCRTPEEVRAQAGGWSGINGVSRTILVDCIQRFMPAKTMLPPGRLETLVTEAVRSQVTSCMFHNEQIRWPESIENVSLLQPHICSVQDFPVFPIQRIDHRDSELYFCIFSPDGNQLATGGKEVNVDIWTVDRETHTISLSRTLFTTEPMVNHMCWSPDSSKLAVCCGNGPGPILVFEVNSRRQICQKQEKTEDVYNSATFFSDSRKLAFGGLKGGAFYIIDTEDDGKLLYTHEYCRVQSMAAVPCSPNASVVVATLAAAAAAAPDCGLDSASLEHILAGATAASSHHPHPAASAICDQLLVVDHMYRIQLFKFAYTIPADARDGEGGTHATTTSAPLHSTTLWSGGSASTTQQHQSVAPIIVALQAAFYARRGGGGGVTGGGSRSSGSSSSSSMMLAGAGAPGADPVPMRQTTSETSFAAAAGGLMAAPSLPRYGHLGANPPVAHLSSSPGSAIGLPNDPRTSQFLLHSLTGVNPAAAGPSLGRYALLALNRETAAAVAAATATGAAPVARGLIPTDYSTGGGVTGSPFDPYISTRNSPAMISRLLSAASGGSAVSTSTRPRSSAATVSGSTPDASSTGESAIGVTTNTEVGGATATQSSTSSAPAHPNAVYSLLHKSTLIKEVHPIQSIVLSPSGKRLLVGFNAKGIVLWDLESRGIIQRFYGHHQVQHKLFYTFCGTNEDFIACGSENGLMHLWHVGTNGVTGLESGRPIHSVVAANERPVTGVHWNPAVPTMMASVNDDGEIRIWGPAKLSTGLA